MSIDEQNVKFTQFVIWDKNFENYTSASMDSLKTTINGRAQLSMGKLLIRCNFWGEFRKLVELLQEKVPYEDKSSLQAKVSLRKRLVKIVFSWTHPGPI